MSIFEELEAALTGRDVAEARAVRAERERDEATRGLRDVAGWLRQLDFPFGWSSKVPAPRSLLAPLTDIYNANPAPGAEPIPIDEHDLEVEQVFGEAGEAGRG